MSTWKQISMLLAAAGVLAGCAEAQPHLADNFGQAVSEALVAQVANPDAQYLGTPAPGAMGAPVALAQERYRTGKVIKPVPATASKVGVAGGAGVSTGQ